MCEGIDVNKTYESRTRIICNYCHFLLLEISDFSQKYAIVVLI